MKLSNRVYPLVDLQSDVENLFDHFFGEGRGVADFAPRANLVESEKDFEITLELPGVDKDDVNVELKDGRLLVTGEKKIELKEPGKSYHRMERRHGKFTRSFEFPGEVDFDKIEASFRQGLLRIVLPKSEKVLPRKVDISIGE